VPLLIAGPGIEEGKILSSPVELLDLFPTFCDLAGLPVPDGLDGESLAPMLLGKGGTRQKTSARSELMAANGKVAFRMARDDRWKYVEFPDSPPVLFDMLNDPGENVNLLASGPAPADCPIDELRRIATGGLSWEEVFAIREEETASRPAIDPPTNHGPVQYCLEDGRIVDADIFLYPGITT